MHWEKLPKAEHNEDAIREYEREENQQIAKLLKRAAWIVIPLMLAIIWFLNR
jgi:hypothetical protein